VAESEWGAIKAAQKLKASWSKAETLPESKVASPRPSTRIFTAFEARREKLQSETIDLVWIDQAILPAPRCRAIAQFEGESPAVPGEL